MSAMLLFLVVVAAVVAWWLSQQRLTAKPWLEEGPIGEFSDPAVLPSPAAKTGLTVFLAVVGSLFALLVSAYFMRRDLAADWRPLPAQPVLWVNTILLVLSSVALQWARICARRDEMEGVRGGLLVGGAAAVAFLIGQILAWRQLAGAGYVLAGNPANTFFYLMTGMHGLHLLGGLAALAKTSAKAWRVSDAGKVRLSVELCTTYWHFLLFVWLLLFALLMRWVDDFVDLCRQLAT